jgi:hypothetical protein
LINKLLFFFSQVANQRTRDKRARYKKEVIAVIHGRMYIVSENINDGVGAIENPARAMDVAVSIVPRCAGRRGVVYT